MRNGNAREYMLFLTASGISFDLQCSNYTMKATVADKELAGLNKTFVANMQSKRTFAAFAKIKSDIKDKPVPDIANSNVRYFQHNFKDEAFFPEVYNVDISSAYATILFNDGIISEETFKYLNCMTKQERLAAVGMLASRKKNFAFRNGNPHNMSETVSPTSGFFFYAVKRTFEIMDTLKMICGENYLFTWVDGIYFLPNDEQLLDCCEYLETTNLKYKTERLTDFRIRIKPSYVDLQFWKGDKIKIFKLPSGDTEFKTILMDATILYNSTNKNEKSKIKNAS